MHKIVFTETAIDDLNSTLSYISNILKAPDASKKLFLMIEEEIIKLQEMPSCHPIIQDDYLSRKGIRSLLVKNYLVFYIVFDDEKYISIIRILYARRNWLLLLNSDIGKNDNDSEKRKSHNCFNLTQPPVPQV
jgi:toxin ParE1/3/4